MFNGRAAIAPEKVNLTVLFIAMQALATDPSGASCVEYLSLPCHKFCPHMIDTYFFLAEYKTWIEPPLDFAPYLPVGYPVNPLRVTADDLLQ